MKRSTRYYIITLSLAIIIGVLYFLLNTSKPIDHSLKFRPYRKATCFIDINKKPADAQATTEFSLNKFIYQNLFKVNNGLEITTDLVDEWSVNRQDKIYDFSFKTKKYFSDGTQVNIKDIYYCLKYLFFKSQSSSFYENIRSIKIKNSETISVTVKDMTIPLLPLLASPRSGIWKKVDNVISYIGSGAYQIQSEVIEPKKKLILTKNKFYAGSANYILSEIEFYEMKESEAKEKLTSGAIDDVIDITFSEPLPENSRYKYLTGIATKTWLVAFNTTALGLNSIAKRKCLVNSFDSNSFAKKYLPQHEVANGYLPPSAPGFGIQIKKFDKTICVKNLIDSLELVIPNEIEKSKEMCDFFRNEWSHIIKSFQCKTINFKDIVKQITTSRHQAALLAMTLGLSSVENILSYFRNHSKFKLAVAVSENLKATLFKLQSTKDNEEKAILFKKANQLIYDESLTLNLTYPKNLFYINSCVQGLNLTVSSADAVNYESVELAANCK